jgi:hypothetical protein
MGESQRPRQHSRFPITRRQLRDWQLHHRAACEKPLARGAAEQPQPESKRMRIQRNLQHKCRNPAQLDIIRKHLAAL